MSESWRFGCVEIWIGFYSWTHCLFRIWTSSLLAHPLRVCLHLARLPPWTKLSRSKFHAVEELVTQVAIVLLGQKKNQKMGRGTIRVDDPTCELVCEADGGIRHKWAPILQLPPWRPLDLVLFMLPHVLHFICVECFWGSDLSYMISNKITECHTTTRFLSDIMNRESASSDFSLEFDSNITTSPINHFTSNMIWNVDSVRVYPYNESSQVRRNTSTQCKRSDTTTLPSLASFLVLVLVGN